MCVDRVVLARGQDVPAGPARRGRRGDRHRGLGRGYGRSARGGRYALQSPASGGRPGRNRPTLSGPGRSFAGAWPSTAADRCSRCRGVATADAGSNLGGLRSRPGSSCRPRACGSGGPSAGVSHEAHRPCWFHRRMADQSCRHPPDRVRRTSQSSADLGRK